VRLVGDVKKAKWGQICEIMQENKTVKKHHFVLTFWRTSSACVVCVVAWCAALMAVLLTGRVSSVIHHPSSFINNNFIECHHVENSHGNYATC
jgi:hypothetical protein